MISVVGEADSVIREGQEPGAKATLARIEAGVGEHTGPAEASDDVTLLAVRRADG